MPNPREFVLALFLGCMGTVPSAITAGSISSPAAVAQARREPASGGKYETAYLSIRVARGWHVGASEDQPLKLSKGKYVLAINPIFGRRERASATWKV